MNIAIMMSVWCQNLGDELILKNEVSLLKQKYSDNTNFRVFTYDLNNIFFSDLKVKYEEYFPIWIKKPKNIIRNLKNYYTFVKTIKWADKVVIWWGGIMFDNESWNYTNPLKLWLFRTTFIKIFKKDIIFYGVSIDVKYEENLGKIKRIFSSWNEVYVRDQASFNLLKDLWISSQIILDPVFHDNKEVWLKNYEKNYLLKKLEAREFLLNDIIDIDFNWKTVWLALRRGYIEKGIVEKEKILINNIIDFILKNWWKIILIPHSFHDIDSFANDYEFLNQFVKSWVTIASSIQESYLVYKQKQIDFCLSMRLHSMILSQVYGINFIALKYSKKGDLM